MKRSVKVMLVLMAFAVLISLMVWITGDVPRRPRPPGFRAEWEGLALSPEGEWALDATKRGVVQGEFFLATDALAACVQEHGGEGANVKLELLVETEQGGTHFEYVDAAVHPDTDPVHPERSRGTELLLSCVTRVLEGAAPVPTPGLPESTRWRLEVNFLVPPLSELPKVPWWRRFIPARWRSGNASGNHIG